MEHAHSTGLSRPGVPTAGAAAGVAADLSGVAGANAAAAACGSAPISSSPAAPDHPVYLSIGFTGPGVTHSLGGVDEQRLGVLEPGRLCDIAALSADCFDADAVSDADLKKVNSVMTLLGGVVTHDTGVVH